MPLYDYHCRDCGATFEKRVAGPRSRVGCPECRSRATTRQLPRVRIQGSSPYAPTFPTGDEGGAPTG